MAAITRLSNSTRFSAIPHYFWRSITTTTTTTTATSAAATTATRPLQTFSRASDLSSRGIQWVFLGCPGVGKGTYASRLSKLLGVPHIAIGDLVRHELSSSGPFFDKPTRHFSSSTRFRPGGSNFGSIRSSADWFHLLNKKKEWYLRLKKKKACRLLLNSPFLKKLHSSIQEKDLKDLDANKKFKYKKGCLGSSFAERNRMKRQFFHSGILNLYIKEKGMNYKNLNHPTQTRRSTDSSYKLGELIYCCASSYQFSMKKREGRSKTKIKKIELPTHISEVNHKTLQAVISYAPTYSELPGYVKRRLGSGAVTTR